MVNTGSWEDDAPVPESEAVRLAILHAIGILDTPPDERYDRLVALASSLTGMPMANLSLVDQDRQWFKARVGIPVASTPRNISFCQYTILNPETLLVEDVTLDARFADSPLVAGDDGVRFYAGTPISVMGENLGALCVLDTKPNSLTVSQLQALRMLADVAALMLHADFVERCCTHPQAGSMAVR